MPDEINNQTNTPQESISPVVSPEPLSGTASAVVSESILLDEADEKLKSRPGSAFANSSSIPTHSKKTKPRDIEVITAEIHTYNCQFGEAAYDVGMLLIEAKGRLNHGEWLDWLRDRVDFSEATARRFMRIAAEYSNRSTLTDLGFSKAVILLGIDKEERDAFIKAVHMVSGTEKRVTEMSCRELKQVVRGKTALKMDSSEPEDEDEADTVLEPETTYYDNEFNPDDYLKNLQERIDGMLDYIKNQEDNFDACDVLSATLRTICENTLKKLQQEGLSKTEI